MLGRQVGPAVMSLPEVNVAIFAFLLNFVWELWQVPFCEGMPRAPQWEVTQICTVCHPGGRHYRAGRVLGCGGSSLSRVGVLRPSTREVWPSRWSASG